MWELGCWETERYFSAMLEALAVKNLVLEKSMNSLVISKFSRSWSVAQAQFMVWGLVLE